MENTYTRPSHTDRMRIFGLYYYCTAIKRGEPADQLFSVVINSAFMREMDGNGGRSVALDEHYPYAIQVKSLSKISGGDLEKLAAFFGPHAKPNTIKTLVTCIEEWADDDALDFPIYTTIRLMDGLRRLGYAVRYGRWSVEQLVKFGIFKLIE